MAYVCGLEGCPGKAAPLRGSHSQQVAEMQPFKTQERICSVVLRTGLVSNGPRSQSGRMQPRLARATGAPLQWAPVVSAPAAFRVPTHRRMATTARVARHVAKHSSTGLQLASDLGLSCRTHRMHPGRSRSCESCSHT